MGSILGTITFWPRGQVPQSRVNPSGQFFLNYEIDRYPEIISTLRYEKPISVYVVWDANNFVTQGHVSAVGENVGEQEGV